MIIILSVRETGGLTWGSAAPTAFATSACGGLMTSEAPARAFSHSPAPPPTTITGTSSATAAIYHKHLAVTLCSRQFAYMPQIDEVLALKAAN